MYVYIHTGKYGWNRSHFFKATISLQYMAVSLNSSIGDVQQERQLHLAHKNSTLMMLCSSDSGHELWSVDVFKILHLT